MSNYCEFLNSHWWMITLWDTSVKNVYTWSIGLMSNYCEFLNSHWWMITLWGTSVKNVYTWSIGFKSRESPFCLPPHIITEPLHICLFPQCCSPNIVLQVVSRLEHVDHKHSGEICFHPQTEMCASLAMVGFLCFLGKLISPNTMLPDGNRHSCLTSGAPISFM